MHFFVCAGKAWAGDKASTVFAFSSRSPLANQLTYNVMQ